MGLFGADDDAEDEGGPKWDMEQVGTSSANTELTKDSHQWEYEILYMDDDEPLFGSGMKEKVDDKGVLSGVLDQIDDKGNNPPLPPVEVFNNLGRNGWELVETVERSVSQVSNKSGGSHTYALIFRRPVEYTDTSGNTGDD